MKNARNCRFAFCGNRFFVLEEMLAAGLNVVSIAAVAESHLERELQRRRIAAVSIAHRTDLTTWLDETAFDVFIANGCPYILPRDTLATKKLFVNIHPSPLPDLRGADPVPGALLFGRDSGASCHIMDAGIDTGDLISRVVIPYTSDLDAQILYQLSFLAEKEAFRVALARNFQPVERQAESADCIYYSRKPDDQMLDWSNSGLALFRRIRAFSNRSQGARFECLNSQFRCFDAELVRNPYLDECLADGPENQIIFNYETTIVVRKRDGFLKIKDIEGDMSLLLPGTVIGSVP